MSFTITMILQQKVLAAPSKSAAWTGRVIGAGVEFESINKIGDYFSHPTGGWVCRFKSGQLALSFVETGTPPEEPPPSTVDMWGIVYLPWDDTERTTDPATVGLTDSPPVGKGTVIKILGWENYVKKINIPTSWAWLLKPSMMWINKKDLPLSADQLVCSCNFLHVIGENTTHWKIETLPNDANTSLLNPDVDNWNNKPHLYHKAISKNSITHVIYLVASGKHVYFPVLRNGDTEMWIRKEFLEMFPTTTTDGRTITSFRVQGANIYGVINEMEVPLRLHPTRDEFWQEPTWVLHTRAVIPPV